MTDVSRKLLSKLQEIIVTVDADLRPYFQNRVKEVEEDIKVKELDKKAQQLVVAWNATIYPITNCKALNVSYISDLGWFDLHIESSDPEYRFHGLKIDTVESGMKLIADKSPALLKYTMPPK